MAKYRKKPVVIDAIVWNGTNKDEINRFLPNCDAGDFYYDPKNNLMIHTLEGIMKANVGDYIIKGVNGEFYPCKPDIFEKTYEKVEPYIEGCSPTARIRFQ
jgi:hypothetical protein